MGRVLGWSFVATTVIISAIAIQVWVPDVRRPTADAPAGAPDHFTARARFVDIPAGRFVMGSLAGIGHEQPPHPVVLSKFSLQPREVSNGQFQQFVNETGYQTTAELSGFGYVMNLQTGTAERVESASWRQPTGPNSNILGRGNLPVVQVSWRDAVAFAHWAALRLPSEAEWEYAARGGLLNQVYPWGAAEKIDGRYQGNYWHGAFPQTDDHQDGFMRLAEVGRFSPSRFGLYDMAGNVREWTNDRYSSDYYQVSPLNNPAGPSAGPQRVVRGGSWASTVSQIVVWARTALPSGYCDDVTGFRCAK